MIAGIIDTERASVFHIDPDHGWVKTEWQTFEKANPGRYRYFRATPSEWRLLQAADGGKLVIHYRVHNRYVNYDCHARPEVLKRLCEAHLLARDDSAGGYRLTRFGQIFSDHLNGRFQEE